MGLEGVGPFKKQGFTFKPGISAIYGLNRAAGKNSNNANGAGKSYFFSSLKEMIFEEPVVGEKTDRTRQGTRVFEFKSPTGKNVKVTREARGRTEHIEIEIDGKELKHLTASKARAALKRLLPITQQDYDTYVHIDARIPHPLVMGTSTERKRFFTDFFGLDKMDAERKLYSAELSKLSKIKAAYSELLGAYNKAKADLLPADEVETVTARLKSLKSKLRTLNEEAAEIAEARRLVSFARDAKEQIEQINVALNGELTDEAFVEYRKANKWELRKIQSDLEEAERYEQYQRDNANYDAAISALSEETKSAVAKSSWKDVRIKAKAGYAELQTVRADLQSIKAKLQSLSAERKDLGDVTVVDKPEGNEEDLATAMRSYQHQLEHAEQFAEGKCETCGQVVKIKDPGALRARVKELKRSLTQHAEYRAYRTSAKEAKRLTLAIDECDTNYDARNADLVKVKPWAIIHQELRDLPSKPAPFEGKRLQVKVLRRMLDELQERRQLLDFFAPHMDTLISYVALTKEQRLKARKGAELHEHINVLQENISKVQAKVEVHNTVKERVQEMRTRLVEMKRSLKEEEPLRLLVAGFSDKHMKKMAIEAISSRLMKIVNEYAKLVFSEDYRFDFVWDTQMQMRVHRKYGKRIDVSDVRKLSGAESKLFTFILVLALLSFVPEHKRSSLMILDEPTANFSAETTQAFQELLPALNQLIPTIIIITPKNEIYEGATVYTAVKQNGRATIVPGFPDQVKRGLQNDTRHVRGH